MMELLPGLPAPFPAPVAIVQHRSRNSGPTLPGVLQRYTKLRVREPLDKEEIRESHVYVAPADYHLMVEDGHFVLSTDPPVLFARPAIDVLFESAADAYGAGAIAVVLTGASADGSLGAARVKERGGTVVVQDPQTAESPLMPREALRATTADHVLPVAEIAPLLARLCS